MKGKQCKSCHYHKPHYMHYPCMSRKLRAGGELKNDTYISQV